MIPKKSNKYLKGGKYCIVTSLFIYLKTIYFYPHFFVAVKMSLSHVRSKKAKKNCWYRKKNVKIYIYTSTGLLYFSFFSADFFMSIYLYFCSFRINLYNIHRYILYQMCSGTLSGFGTVNCIGYFPILKSCSNSINWRKICYLRFKLCKVES